MNPRIFATPADMQKAIEAYKTNIKLGKDKPTLTGMIYEIGLDSRATFDNYIDYDDGAYAGIIRSAKLWIECAYEQNLHETGCTGSIFALKNFGWHDQQSHHHSGSVGLREILNDIDGSTAGTPDKDQK